MKRLPRDSSLRGFQAATAAAETRGVANYQSWLPAPSLSGVTVTPDTALSLAAVYACVSVIALNVASLPFQVFERLKPRGRQPRYDHPVNDLLEVEPNDELSAFGFWSAILFQACLRGNGIGEIERDEWSGEPVGLHLLDWNKSECKRHTDGRVYYEIQREREGSNENGIVGLSPIAACPESVSSLVAAEKMGAASFGNAHSIAGSIETEDELDDIARKNIREGISKVHQGPYNAAKILFLEQGLKYNPFKISLADYQHLEYRKWGPQEIARLFGVPPHKIGDLSNATYSNIEEQNIEFAMGTLRLWCQRISSESNRKLFTKEDRRRFFTQHNMNAVMRGNSESLSKWLRSVFGMGGYSINDVCEEVGVNPIGPAGDVRYVEAQLVKLADTAPTANPVDLPSDPEPQQQPEPGPVTTPAAEIRSAELLAAVRRSIESDLTRWSTKETNAVRRAAKREDFTTWSTEFYSEQGPWLAGALAPGVELLGLVVNKRLAAEDLASQLIQQSQQVLQQTQPAEFTSDPLPAFETYVTSHVQA
jgi:HK97 family phage portal protein